MCCIHIDEDRVESNMEIHFCHSNCCAIEHPIVVDISLLPIFKHKSPFVHLPKFYRRRKSQWNHPYVIRIN